MRKILMKIPIPFHKFLKTAVLGLLMAAVCTPLTACKKEQNKPQQNEQKQAVPSGGKTLILYFSHSGNTRHLAEQIHAKVGGDIAEIKTVKPYPQDYDTVVEQAKKEQKDNFRPQLATSRPDLKTYDVVFIGYPNWWGTLPMALFTFLEANSLAGKAVIPFSTHEGSHFGRSISDLKTLAPQATILEGLAVRGRSVKDASTEKELAAWLTRLNLPQVKR